MKLERKLWVLTLFLTFVMVIPGTTLAQNYNLSGTWSWRETEVGDNFTDGRHNVEPQEPQTVCINHFATGNPDLYFNIEIWWWNDYYNQWELTFVGGTGSFFIGFASLYPGPYSQDAFTGRVSKNEKSITAQFISSQYESDEWDDAGTGLGRLTMTKVSEGYPCAQPSY